MLNLFKNKYPNYILVILLISILNQSCAPVFSELQSARTVGDNRFEFTPSFSTVSFSENGESDGVQDHFGIQTAYGITDKIDIRARYERIWIKGSELMDGTSIIGVGPKLSLMENKIAFSLPIGRALGEGSSDSWQTHPTFLFTLPAVQDKVDLTLTPKYLMQFCEDCENLIAVNLGASLSKDLRSWAIRPEYGMLFNPGEPGFYGQFSIGFSKAFGQ